MNKAGKLPVTSEKIDSHRRGNDLILKEIWNLWVVSKILKNMITLVYSSTVMTNVSDTKLKEWVVPFWKEGRLTP